MSILFSLALATKLLCPIGCQDPAQPEVEYLEFRGSRWVSARLCRDGSPTCWVPRFRLGDTVRWRADVAYNQGNNGFYEVTGVYFQDSDEWPVWVMDVDPPAPVYGVFAGGQMFNTSIFHDGFESGGLGAWFGSAP